MDKEVPKGRPPRLGDRKTIYVMDEDWRWLKMQRIKPSATIRELIAHAKETGWQPKEE